MIVSGAASKSGEILMDQLFLDINNGGAPARCVTLE